MAYVKTPPPSIESMLDQFADWMAQYASAKVIVRMEYRDGTHWTCETDHRGPRPKVGAGTTTPDGHNAPGEGLDASAACGQSSREAATSTGLLGAAPYEERN